MMLEDRTRRAVAAAQALGAEHGLVVDAPVVLHDLFSVVVHLAPAPVVVRTPTVLPSSRRADPDRVVAERRDEIAVSVALDGIGFPTTRPSPLLPAEPLVRDGFVLTAWEFVEILPDEQVGDPAGLVADLHAALRTVEVDLPFLGFWQGWFPEMFDLLAGRPDLLGPDDLDLARREHARLDEVLGSRQGLAVAFPHAGVQPVHGDAPTHNVVVTPGGPLVSDFENACLGPVEWDLALTGLAADYDAATVLRGGRPLDRELLALCEQARWLQIVSCLGLAAEAPPSLTEALVGLVGTWRDQIPR